MMYLAVLVSLCVVPLSHSMECFYPVTSTNLTELLLMDSCTSVIVGPSLSDELNLIIPVLVTATSIRPRMNLTCLQGSPYITTDGMYDEFAIRYTGSMLLSVHVLGCRFLGGGIDVSNAVNARVFVANCSFNGLNRSVSLDINGVWDVTLVNLSLENGKHDVFFYGGGCLGIRGVSNGTINVTNVVMRQCKTLAQGGCLLIDGNGIPTTDLATDDTSRR
eukprot:PhF_6_TR9609/c0_g1_i1/m.14856